MKQYDVQYTIITGYKKQKCQVSHAKEGGEVKSLQQKQGNLSSRKKLIRRLN